MEMYSADCKLYFQPATFLIVLTLKQYVNAKTIWGREVRNINHYYDYCQPLTTYAASIPAQSWSFSGEAGCFWTESAFYPWYVVFNQHFTLSLQLTPGLRSAVCSLQSALTLTDIKKTKSSP